MKSKPRSLSGSHNETSLAPIKIRSIVAAPLFGESPKGGWSAEIKPEDTIHALIAVHTDAGTTGYGSVFIDGRLVQAGLKVLEPLFIGENALEPERITEKLHQNTFWMGRGGTLKHTISGIDIAPWTPSLIAPSSARRARRLGSNPNSGWTPARAMRTGRMDSSGPCARPTCWPISTWAGSKRP